MTDEPPADVDPIRTSDAARLVRRPAATIRSWGHKGWIRRVGTVGRQATWNRSDLLAAEAALAARHDPPTPPGP